MKASDVVDLLNNVEVNCYGIMTLLPQLSTVTIKDDTVVLVSYEM
jgi:ribosome recycling factor